MNNNKYTPENINNRFVIPLYQRLFEWDENEILQLLNDLYTSFKENKENPYYIGLFTVFQNEGETEYSLVDGQQRFTVLTLMGIAFGWRDFLVSNGVNRLLFFARKKDEQFLTNKIHGITQKKEDYVNKKMDDGILFINKFVDKKDDKEDFIQYIYKKTTFFISKLPKDYSIQDLNSYFERMNEAGKGLENHEILKVKLLNKAGKKYQLQKTEESEQTKKIKEEDQIKKTLIWNSVSEMATCLVSQKEDENQDSFRNKYLKILQNISVESVFNKISKHQDIERIKKDVNNKPYTIKSIKSRNESPNIIIKQRDENALLSFSEFLLQVLWLSIDSDKRENPTDFFNKHKLLETFDNYVLSNESIVNIDCFYNNLLRYRILFDYFIIRLNNTDNRNTTYSINYKDSRQESITRNKLIKYQSMLYVSISSYRWLTPVLEYLDKNYESSMLDLLNFIKKWDNRHHLTPNIKLNYPSINRYWFWRLDYYLWDNREKYFKDRTLEIANDYVFKANRSIEHILPQHIQEEDKTSIDKKYLHIFGNLVMISSGQNSSLQNESFEMKQAHVRSYINKGKNNSIESLKMLKLYEYDKWDNDKVISHHNEMIEVLISSFNSEENTEKYKPIIEELRGNKIYSNEN